jgi:hypothetical protein
MYLHIREREREN